jgi:hypothetical protein
MKAKTMFHALALTAVLVSSVSAHAGGKKRDSARYGEEVGDTTIVSIHEAGTAGRIADRLIIRSQSSLEKRNIPTVANVFGDRISYTQEAGKLSKLSAFSEEVLMHLAQTGKCDLTDSDCIVFEDKKDAVYRVATTPASDGSIAVLIGQMDPTGSAHNSNRGLMNRIDKTTRSRSVIYTRAGSSY